jgi:hypothetical protein
VLNHTELASFIPTKSALAYHWNSDQLATNLGENLTNRNLVCTGETPFDAYYQAPTAIDFNSQHIALNPSSANFIAVNMGLAPPMSPIVYDFEVVGPKGVQIGSRTSFTAKYIGNYEFLTNWSIVENSGVTTTLAPRSEIAIVSDFFSISVIGPETQEPLPSEILICSPRLKRNTLLAWCASSPRRS